MLDYLILTCLKILDIRLHAVVNRSTVKTIFETVTILKKKPSTTKIQTKVDFYIQGLK